MIQAKVRRWKLEIVSEQSFGGAHDVLTNEKGYIDIGVGWGDLRDEMTPDTRSSSHRKFVSAKQMRYISRLEDIQRDPVDHHEDPVHREGGWIHVRNALKPASVSSITGGSSKLTHKDGPIDE